jgi:hypothetical protein
LIYARDNTAFPTQGAELRKAEAPFEALIFEGYEAVIKDGWRPMTWERGQSQYSSASITVITRTVTAGSVGSGEW